MDVCGHGVPAALITTLAKISFITNTRQHLKSGEIVTLVNRELNAIIREIGNYLTAFYAIIDTERQEIEYTNASHNDIYILSKDKTLKALKPNGTVVGIIGDLVYESQTESIQLEDKIVFYTDGIPEARNPQRKMYSDARLKEILIENREHSPQDLINKVLYDVNHFKEGCASDDDMTILIASFTEHKGDIAYDPDPIIDYAREEVNFSENEKFKTLNFDYKTAIELYKNRNFIESNIILMKILPEFKRKNDKFNILYLTGHNYYQLNELDHCRECWNRCHDINPNNKELIDNLEILERKMNPEK
jgi:tetratricopeptide (TPR) repeat protein